MKSTILFRNCRLVIGFMVAYLFLAGASLDAYDWGFPFFGGGGVDGNMLVPDGFRSR